MSSPQMAKADVTPAAATVDLKLEVVVIPVADVDRSKRFYESLGWRVDGDFTNGPDWRAGADDAARVGVLDPVRHGHHDSRAGLDAGNLIWSCPAWTRHAPS